MDSRELPFRIVVLADLSGNPETPLPRAMQRRLISITRECFTHIFHAQRPRVMLRAPGRAKTWAVEFAGLRDFGQEQIVSQLLAKGAAEDEAREVAAAAPRDAVFAAVCSAWHTLDQLLRAAGNNPKIAIHCWNVSKRDLLRDLQRAPELDQSVLFKRVYSELIGTLAVVPRDVSLPITCSPGVPKMSTLPKRRLRLQPLRALRFYSARRPRFAVLPPGKI